MLTQVTCPAARAAPVPRAARCRDSRCAQDARVLYADIKCRACAHYIAAISAYFSFISWSVTLPDCCHFRSPAASRATMMPAVEGKGAPMLLARRRCLVNAQRRPSRLFSPSPSRLASIVRQRR